MVCKKCEKKLGAIVVPDQWKAGSRNSTAKREIGGNKLLSKRKGIDKSAKKKAKLLKRQMKLLKATAAAGDSKCKICKGNLHSLGHHYCNECAFRKGICSMCGKKVAETKMHRNSTT
eukprot:TRINITY_DN65838_c0_g1_i1.p1 TRINITY_DN65838_c0_g1~~TRINITY_DN65838_c0_g1_i1.p1  ORF type:complete len:117 (+),score=49.06 TRINITY_DN65838_c0_g1_i1:56-406(+)